MPRRYLKPFLSISILLAFIWGCAKMVKIPDTEAEDSAPLVSITDFVRTGSSTVLRETSTYDHYVKVAAGTELVVIAGAESPGAVHTLALNVVKGTTGLYFVQVGAPGTGTPPEGRESLSIWGTGGIGVPGDAPIQFTIGSEDVQVVATAINFHNTPTTVTLTYTAQCPSCPPHAMADDNCVCICQVYPGSIGNGTDPTGKCGGFCCGPDEYCCNGQCIRFDQLCCPGSNCPPGSHCEPQYPGVCCPNGTSYNPSSGLCYPSSWGF